MKDIDFLPLHFHERRYRRQQNARNVLYVAVVATSLAVLHGLNASDIRSAQAALNVLEADSTFRQTQRARLEGLRVTRSHLQKEAELLNELADDAPVDSVIAEINRLMGPTTALRSVSLKTAPPAESDDKKAIDPVRQRGRTGGIVQGVAADDVEVGTFFGRLSSSPLFEEVRLSYSHEAQQSGRSMREFELKFLVRAVVVPEKTGT